MAHLYTVFDGVCGLADGVLNLSVQTMNLLKNQQALLVRFFYQVHYGELHSPYLWRNSADAELLGNIFPKPLL